MRLVALLTLLAGAALPSGCSKRSDSAAEGGRLISSDSVGASVRSPVPLVRPEASGTDGRVLAGQDATAGLSFFLRAEPLGCEAASDEQALEWLRALAARDNTDGTWERWDVRPVTVAGRPGIDVTGEVDLGGTRPMRLRSRRLVLGGRTIVEAEASSAYGRDLPSLDRFVESLRPTGAPAASDPDSPCGAPPPPPEPKPVGRMRAHLKGARDMAVRGDVALVAARDQVARIALRGDKAVRGFSKRSEQVRAVAVDGDDVVWGDYAETSWSPETGSVWQGRLFRQPLASGPAKEVGRVEGMIYELRVGPAGIGIAHDRREIGHERVISLARRGGPVERVAVGLEPRLVDVGREDVVWLTQDPQSKVTTLWRRRVGGDAGPQKLATLAPGDKPGLRPCGVSHGDDLVVMTAAGAVAVPRRGGETRPMTGDVGLMPGCPLVDRGWLLWPTHSELRRWPLGGGEVEVLIEWKDTPDDVVATDDGYVFLTVGDRLIHLAVPPAMRDVSR